MNLTSVWLRAIWSWLTDARHTWLAVGVTAVALVVSLRPGVSEPVIRLTGLVLQLLGIGTVIWGISETRALFGHPSIASKARAWLGRFPLLRRSAVVSVSGVAGLTATGRLHAVVTHVPGTSPTIDARVEALEKNISAIHERITQTQQEMDAEFQKTASATKREEQVRESEDRAILEKLEATGTGGVHISAIGALWLFIGVALSTAAQEIACILK